MVPWWQWQCHGGAGGAEWGWLLHAGRSGALEQKSVKCTAWAHEIFILLTGWLWPRLEEEKEEEECCTEVLPLLQGEQGWGRTGGSLVPMVGLSMGFPAHHLWDAALCLLSLNSVLTLPPISRSGGTGGDQRGCPACTSPSRCL